MSFPLPVVMAAALGTDDASKQCDERASASARGRLTTVNVSCETRERPPDVKEALGLGGDGLFGVVGPRRPAPPSRMVFGLLLRPLVPASPRDLSAAYGLG